MKKNNIWKGLGILALTLSLATATTACGKKDTNLTTWVNREVQVYCTVTPGGQHPYKITARLDASFADKVTEEDLVAGDYAFSGKATGWMSDKLEDFSAEVDSVSLEDDLLTFTFTDFPKKYFYVDSWFMTNSKNPNLSFKSEQVTGTYTEVADKFRMYTEEEEDFNFNLYMPEDLTKTYPLVVVFHGFSDTNNLLAYRTSVAWAEPEAQEKWPCIILAPIIPDEDYYTSEGRDAVYKSLYEKIQGMIENRDVDPDRIYIMGNSFGGMATIEFCEKYPELPAGAMALCSALNYSETAMDHLEAIMDIPLRIYHAENDSTIPSSTSKEMAQKLMAAGDTKVEMHIFSDEEMNAAGGSSDPNSTYSYHHVELAIMDKDEYMGWLYSQVK